MLYYKDAFIKKLILILPDFTSNILYSACIITLEPP